MADAFLHRRSIFDKHKDSYSFKNPIKQMRVSRSWSNPIIRHKREKSLHDWANSFAGKRHYRKLSRHNALHLHEEVESLGIPAVYCGSTLTLADGSVVTGISPGIRGKCNITINAVREGDFTRLIPDWDEHGNVFDREVHHRYELDYTNHGTKYDHSTAYLNDLGALAHHEAFHLCEEHMSYDIKDLRDKLRTYLKNEVEKVDLDYDVKALEDSPYPSLAITSRPDDGHYYLEGYLVELKPGDVRFKYQYYGHPHEEVVIVGDDAQDLDVIAKYLFAQVEPKVAADEGASFAEKTAWTYLEELEKLEGEESRMEAAEKVLKALGCEPGTEGRWYSKDGDEIDVIDTLDNTEWAFAQKICGQLQEAKQAKKAYPKFVQISTQRDFDKYIKPALGKGADAYGLSDIKDMWWEIADGEKVPASAKTVREIRDSIDKRPRFVFISGVGDERGITDMSLTEYASEMGMSVSDYLRGYTVEAKNEVADKTGFSAFVRELVDAAFGKFDDETWDRITLGYDVGRDFEQGYSVEDTVHRIQDWAFAESKKSGSKFTEIKAAIKAAWSAAEVKWFRLDFQESIERLDIYPIASDNEGVGVNWGVLPERNTIVQYATDFHTGNSEIEREMPYKGLDELEKVFVDEFKAMDETLEVSAENGADIHPLSDLGAAVKGEAYGGARFGKHDIVQALAKALHNDEDDKYSIRYFDSSKVGIEPGYAYASNKEGEDAWKVLDDGTVEFEFAGKPQGKTRVDSLSELESTILKLFGLQLGSNGEVSEVVAIRHESKCEWLDPEGEAVLKKQAPKLIDALNAEFERIGSPARLGLASDDVRFSDGYYLPVKCSGKWDEESRMLNARLEGNKTLNGVKYYDGNIYLEKGWRPTSFRGARWLALHEKLEKMGSPKHEKADEIVFEPVVNFKPQQYAVYEIDDDGDELECIFSGTLGSAKKKLGDAMGSDPNKKFHVVAIAYTPRGQLADSEVVWSDLKQELAPATNEAASRVVADNKLGKIVKARLRDNVLAFLPIDDDGKNDDCTYFFKVDGNDIITKGYHWGRDEIDRSMIADDGYPWTAEPNRPTRDWVHTEEYAKQLVDRVRKCLDLGIATHERMGDVSFADLGADPTDTPASHRPLENALSSFERAIWDKYDTDADYIKLRLSIYGLNDKSDKPLYTVRYKAGAEKPWQLYKGNRGALIDSFETVKQLAKSFAKEKHEAADTITSRDVQVAARSAWSTSGATDFKLDIVRLGDSVIIYTKGLDGKDNVGISWHINIPDPGGVYTIEQYADWGTDRTEPERKWNVKDLDELEKSLVDEFKSLQDTIDVGKEN